LVKIRARNLAGEKAIDLDEELDIKKWTIDKVMLGLKNKLENDGNNPMV